DWLRWRNLHGYDFHLLPGLATPPLTNLLVASIDDDETDATDLPDGVTLTFATNLTTHQGTGVSLRADGRVSLTNPLPGPTPALPRLRSFIVPATLSDGTQSVTARVRIHVHDGLTRTWLTPTQLTVHRGASPVKFTHLALFDDGVIGDISNWTPVEDDPD